MTKPTKQPPASTPAAAEQLTQAQNGFKALALPAVVAAARRKPQGRNERRVGLVLDPARYAD
ncbi:MAG: hypothetical protein LCH39_04960 [Proteobacteria bacterium]|nr:hypothetical protein [Pseudomonadota bacterium]